MENNDLYILGTAQADREAAEWHRQQYRECFAPSPGQYNFCVLLETQVKQYGIEKGLERAKSIVKFEINLHLAGGGGISYFRDIYGHMPTPFDTESLRDSYNRLVYATPNENTIKSVKRFAWWPTNINNGLNWVFLRYYIEVYQWVSVGKWRSTGKKFIHADNE